MSGHSKWSTIKHKKAVTDAKKGKITTRLVKEITVAAKFGGGDPTSNPRLRLAIEKARGNNVLKENIERAIKRGTGEIEGAHYEELRFEGYGIGGVGVIVDCLTDNKTRTIAQVRHVFDKYGGNLGTDGCVAFQFKHCGQFLFPPNIKGENALVEFAIDIGADDVIVHNDRTIEVITTPDKFLEVKTKLEHEQLKYELGELVMKAENEIILSGEEAKKMHRLLEAFDELEDVQEVYTAATLDYEEESSK